MEGECRRHGVHRGGSRAMKRPARLAALLDVRPGEGLPVALLLGHSFALGGAGVFAEVSATALFLTTFGAANLAYVYLAAPALIALIGAGYAQLAGRVADRRL